MSWWHPKLVVRRGKGGDVYSPTDTSGFLLYGLIGLLVSALLVPLLVMRGGPWGLLVLLLTLVPLYDATAWLLATDAERECFRSEVALVKAMRVRPSFTNVTAGNGRPIGVVLLGIAGVASMIVGWQQHPGLFLLSMFLFSFAVASTIDVVRGMVQKT